MVFGVLLVILASSAWSNRVVPTLKFAGERDVGVTGLSEVKGISIWCLCLSFQNSREKEED
jgi:hypothetical protein